MNPGDILFTRFISLPSSRILTAISGPMTKNDFNIHLANYALIVYELNYTTNSIHQIQQVKISFPIHNYAISTLQDSILSPQLCISTDKKYSNFIMLSTSCSGYVMIISLTSTGKLFWVIFHWTDITDRRAEYFAWFIYRYQVSCSLCCGISIADARLDFSDIPTGD